jgi:hypothetical protein
MKVSARPVVDTAWIYGVSFRMFTQNAERGLLERISWSQWEAPADGLVPHGQVTLEPHLQHRDSGL